MLIQDRYASAIRSSNLQTDERTTYSDTDVLGAFGLAGKEHPLSVALQRLFLGDNGAAAEVVAILADLLRGKAPMLRVKVTEAQATDMARACLAWHRDGTCKTCGGHGVMLIRGTRTLGDQACRPCNGTGKRPFEKEFHESFRELAAWLISEMERHQARAGGVAMAEHARYLEMKNWILDAGQ